MVQSLTQSDSPAWTESTAATGAFTRYLADPDGGLAATVTDTGTVELQLANLHGDLVAAAGPSDTTPASYTETTEYGQPRDPTTPTGRYGWLGTHQRATDTRAGLTLMGVRLYNPLTGRFLTVDSEPGGSSNTYDYTCANPVNATDLDGKRCWLGRNPDGSCRGSRQASWAGRTWRTNRYVRWGTGVLIVSGAAAACGLTWSIACGAAAGAAYGMLKYRYTRTRGSRWGYARAGAWVALPAPPARPVRCTLPDGLATHSGGRGFGTLTGRGRPITTSDVDG